MSFSISKVPRTFAGKLTMVQEFMNKAEESFDNDHKTNLYSLTEEEYDAFTLIQTLGTDFFKQLEDIIDYAHPSALLARDEQEAKDVIDAHR